MVLLYVGVRGVALARRVPTTPPPAEPGELLEENLRVAMAAGLWFVGAPLTTELQTWSEGLGSGMLTGVAELLSFVCVGTGVATAGEMTRTLAPPVAIRVALVGGNVWNVLLEHSSIV